MFTNSRHARGARTAVIYITVGALIVVWSGIWCVNLLNDPTRGDNALSWCYGLLLTGATFVLIGLAIGWIGRSGRSAAGARKAVSSAQSPGDTPEEGQMLTSSEAKVAAAPGIGQDQGRKSL
jgi:hypothetical protein